MVSLLRDCGYNNIVAQFVFIINYQLSIRYYKLWPDKKTTDLI